MGDDPCQEDCAIFGMLAQLKWHAPNTPLEKMLKGQLNISMIFAMLTIIQLKAVHDVQCHIILVCEENKIYLDL